MKKDGQVVKRQTTKGFTYQVKEFIPSKKGQQRVLNNGVTCIDLYSRKNNLGRSEQNGQEGKSIKEAENSVRKQGYWFKRGIVRTKVMALSTDLNEREQIQKRFKRILNLENGIWRMIPNEKEWGKKGEIISLGLLTMEKGYAINGNQDHQRRKDFAIKKMSSHLTR